MRRQRFYRKEEKADNKISMAEVRRREDIRTFCAMLSSAFLLMIIILLSIEFDPLSKISKTLDYMPVGVVEPTSIDLIACHETDSIKCYCKTGAYNSATGFCEIDKGECFLTDYGTACPAKVIASAEKSSQSYTEACPVNTRAVGIKQKDLSWRFICTNKTNYQLWGTDQ